MKPLPPSHHILPYSIPFKVPGFANHYIEGLETLAPENIDSEEWFNQFADSVISRIGKEYYPVCRLSDGEFKLLLGEQPLDELWPLWDRIKSIINFHISKSLKYSTFNAGGCLPSGTKLYSSGTYTNEETITIRMSYTKHLLDISRCGALAIHLTHGTIQPFQQHYFPALGRWLNNNNFVLTSRNCIPFYFVYALLRGNRAYDLLNHRRVLVVHSAIGTKREMITRSLESAGTSNVEWVEVSSERSWYDQLNIAPYLGKVDICLIGAGVGKPKVLQQLQPLNVPCIDAGYAFEAWADPNVAKFRAFMLPDNNPLSHELLNMTGKERAQYDNYYKMNHKG